MFSPAIGRVVRSPSSLPAPSVCVFGRPATLAAAPRPSHQRRLSSSKASIPPDGSDANGSSSTQQTPASAGKTSVRKMTGRTGRKRASTPPVPALNVPHVPPTDFLQKPEVKISSFFSLHRPMSLDRAIPPVATHASFESIFAPRSPFSPKTTAENMQTLSSGIESLEAALAYHEKQAPPAEETSQADVQHLNSPPPGTLEDLMAKFVPFQPPPPPVPFGQAASQPSSTVEDVVAKLPVKQRAWSSTVVVTESVDASGKRTFSATTEPLVPMHMPAAEGQEAEQYEARQPFLERMRERQYMNNRSRDTLQRPDMLAISVKRQRKLKMKKHKYKKLMKRTRLLRRKLDRL